MNESYFPALAAVVDRIIPPEAGMPGGVEAGAFDYLVGMFSSDLAREAEKCEMFLDELGPSFSALPTDAQDAELRRVADGAEFRAFFRRLCEWAQEGFYTSPAGMKMIGWEIKG